MQPSDASPPSVAPPPTAPGWRRLAVASPILNSITVAYRLWPLFLLAVVNRRGGPVLGIILAVGALITLAVEIARYLRFDYRLEGTTLVVRSGVLVRRTRTVPADRVQQVSLNQKLRHRVFGLTEVSVEVAGAGSEPDVSLSAVSRGEAERIRVRLQDARRAAGTAPPEPDQVIYTQPNGYLLRWAAFSSPLFVVPAFGAAIGAFDDALDLEQAWGWIPDGSQLWFVAAAALLGLAGATILNGARFYDMRLVRSDRDFRLTYGLLTSRQLELPPDRIQALITKLSPAGRLSRTVGIRVHNASSAGEATESYLPATPREARRQVIEALMPEAALEPALRRHPKAALRRSLIRWVTPTTFIALVAWGLLRQAPAAGLLLLTLPAAALGLRAWRVLGHGETPDAVVGRRGAITDRTTVVRISRIQSTSVAANWFQRRLELATLHVHVAQPLGRVVIRDMDVRDATDLAGRLSNPPNPTPGVKVRDGGSDSGHVDHHGEGGREEVPT